MSEKLPASLIRAYCDGELPPEDSRALEKRLEHDSALRAAVAFEHSLRDHVAAVQRAEGTVPEGLAERIVAAWSAEPSAPTAEAPKPRTTPQPVVQVSTSGRSWLDAVVSLLAGPRQVSAMAVLGVLAIVGAVVLYGILGTPIDDLSPNANGDLPTEIALFAAGEHDRCAMNSEALEDKVAVRSEPEAVLDISAHLNVGRVTIFDLTSVGYEFVGEGHCKVPGTARSAHMVYRRESPGRRTAYASLFVAPYIGPLGCFDSGRSDVRAWDQVRCEKVCKKAVFRTVDGELIYFLVCCDPSDREAIADEISRTLARQGS